MAHIYNKQITKKKANKKIDYNRIKQIINKLMIKTKNSG